MTVDLTTDLHSHSDLTDGADSPEEMALAARRAGLTTWALSDHVRADSTWVGGYLRRVRRIRVDGLTVRCAVEAKILDTTGRIDLPRLPPGLDHVLVADHQVPGPDGPLAPRDVGAALAGGSVGSADVVDDLVSATCRAVEAAPLPVVVAHLFSILPKVGLTEALVTDEHLDALAASCRRADARVEVNEKWRCPSARVAVGLHDRGVRLVLGSDAHAADRLGAGPYVRSVVDRMAVAV